MCATIRISGQSTRRCRALRYSLQPLSRDPPLPAEGPFRNKNVMPKDSSPFPCSLLPPGMQSGHVTNGREIWVGETKVDPAGHSSLNDLKDNQRQTRGQPRKLFNHCRGRVFVCCAARSVCLNFE